MFGMVYSSYVLLIWVHFLPHAHNFLLQVWLEQGLPGFVAIVWLIAAFYICLWRSRRTLTWLGWGAIAAASVVFLHGLVEQPAVPGFRVLPLMFVPFGLAMGTAQAPEKGRPEMVADRRPLLLALGLVLLAMAVMAHDQVMALWYVNLGSVEQTRTELRNYSFPSQLVDDVRHNGDFDAAQSYFAQALEYAQAIQAPAIAWP